MATSTGSTSTNVGSLNVAELVDKLMKVEHRSQALPIAKKSEGINAAISAYGSLKAALSTYQIALKALNPASFTTLKASVSNAGVGSNLGADALSAELNRDDQTKKLAQKLQSAGFAGNQVFQAGDVMAIKVGNHAPAFITLKADATLAGLRGLINASKAGVSASIVSDGSGQRLVLESNSAGAANTIRVTAAGSLARLAYDPNGAVASTMTQTQAPRDEASAAAGSYAIDVLQLAQTHKLSSAAIAPGTTFNDGILAIRSRDGATALIRPANNSLSGVRDAINASDAAVNASIVNDGSSEHLIISAKESGAGNAVRITGTGAYAIFAFDESGATSLPAQPADRTYDSGSLRLSVGQNTVDIQPTDLDGNGTIGLHDVMASINNASAGVTASIAGSGGEQRLVLTPAGSGAVSIAGSGSYAALRGSSMGQSLKAQDAKVSIDGVTITSASNNVGNALSGVQLNLAKVTGGGDRVMLKIDSDSSGMTSAANAFVSAYNTLVKTVSDLTRFAPANKRGEKGSSSPLAAESAVRNLMAQLRGVMVAPVAGNDDASHLAMIGITLQKGGTLALDGARFADVTNKKFQAVSHLFGSTDGVLPRIQTLMEQMLDRDGVVAKKTEGLKASARRNEERYEDVSRRLDDMRDRYTIKFNQLNITMAKAEQRGNYMLKQLENLEKRR